MIKWDFLGNNDIFQGFCHKYLRSFCDEAVGDLPTLT